MTSDFSCNAARCNRRVALVGVGVTTVLCLWNPDLVRAEQLEASADQPFDAQQLEELKQRAPESYQQIVRDQEVVEIVTAFNRSMSRS